MAITTWLDDNDRETYKNVHDKELNELFQEVRQKVSNRYLIQQHVHIKRKWIFGKSQQVWHYTLYIDLEFEAQVFNFPSEQSSINGLVSKSMLMTYFFGVINGFDSAQRAFADRPAPHIQPLHLPLTINNENYPLHIHN